MKSLNWIYLCLIASLSFAVFSASAELKPDSIYQGSDLTETPLEQILQRVQPGDLIFVGEFHRVDKHHEFQKLVIQELIRLGHRVHVGIEHFSYLDQPALDAYLKGELSEQDLARIINLSNLKHWRDQLKLPLSSNGWSFGLNAPRWLTSKINSIGYDLLSPEEKQILPSDFTLGSPEFKQRFMDLSGIKEPTADFDKAFAAQSAWDDTSAWRLNYILQQDPQSVIVVLFGDFHVTYGDALPARTRLRGARRITSFSQFCADNLTQEEIKRQAAPHLLYGVRADYVRPTDCSLKNTNGKD